MIGKTLVFAVAILSSSADAADVTSGLIARWNMAQSAGANAIADASGNGRTLTFGPGCSITNDVFGFKEALFFDGTSDAYASFQMPSVSDGNMTWSFWLWRERADPAQKDGQQGQHLVVGQLRAGVGFNLRLDNSKDNTWAVYYGRDASDGWYSFGEADAAPRGCWTHYVFTFAMAPTQTEGWNGTDFNGTITCYANGRVRFSQTQVYRYITIPSSKTWTIGNTFADGTGKRPFYGAIADCRVYKRALSAAEVTDLCAANLSAQIHPAGQIAHFPMETIVSDPALYAGTNYVANAASTGTVGSDLLLHKITPYAADDAPHGQAITFKTETVDSSAAMFSKIHKLGDITYAVWYKKGTPVAPNTYGPRFVVLNSTFYRFEVENDYFYYVWANSKGAISGSRTSTPGWKHAVFTITNSWDSVAGRWKAFMRVYENGELMQTVDDVAGRDAASAIPGNMNFLIGNSGFINAARGYEGEMDEIRVFDRALDADEIRELYKTGSVTFDIEKPSVTVTVGDPKSPGLKTFRNGVSDATAITGEWRVVEGNAEKVVFSDKTSSQSTVTVTEKGAFKIQFLAGVGYGFAKSPEIALTGVPKGCVLLFR